MVLHRSPYTITSEILSLVAAISEASERLVKEGDIETEGEKKNRTYVLANKK